VISVELSAANADNARRIWDVSADLVGARFAA